MPIYFILAEDVNLVKIGHSRKPESRLKALQCASPVQLTLLVHIPGLQEKELVLHKKFKHLRRRGEWFEYTRELKTFVKRLKSKHQWEPDTDLILKEGYMWVLNKPCDKHISEMTPEEIGRIEIVMRKKDS